MPTDRIFSWQYRYAPYLFVSPFLLLFGLFGLYPLIKSLILSFYISEGPKSLVFVGLDNFRFLLTDPDFHTAVRNTAVFALFSVFLQLPMSLGLALLLNQPWLKAREWFRLAFFYPHLVGQVFVAVLFSVLFIPQFGLLNRALHALVGLALDTKWLADPRLVMPALVLTSLWMYVGFNMIYFLAALQAVDRDLYAAALVDGANGWQQFWHVTLPGIIPTVMILLILRIGRLLSVGYEKIILLYNPAIYETADVISSFVYRKGLQEFNWSYGSAVGMFNSVINLLLLFMANRVSRKISESSLW